jgi:hypothetical protein
MKKKLSPINQAHFSFLDDLPNGDLGKVISKGYMVISQIKIKYRRGLTLTIVESLPGLQQKHPERLPAKIQLVVETIESLEQQKKVIRKKVLDFIQPHEKKSSDH